jgi:hypothetical protein
MKYRIVFLSLLSAGLASLCACGLCKRDDYRNDKKQTAIPATNEIDAVGYIGSIDEDTRDLVTRLLAARHIEVKFSGSVVYYVLVDKDQAQAAQDILKGSAELKSKWIKYTDLSGPSK